MSQAISYAPSTPAQSGWINRLVAWLTAHKLAVMIIALLFVASLSLRLLVFDRYLPFLDYSDETVPFLVAQSWRGLDTNEFIRWRYAGYPPAFVQINIFVQQIVEILVNRPWTVPPDHFFALRLIAAVVGSITSIIVASIGWQLSGKIGALLAGLVWALAPIIVEHNSLATPDPYVYLTCASAVSMALYAWRTNSFRWLFGSLVMGILAIYFKLWPIHAVIPFVLVSLIFIRKQPRHAIMRLLPHAVFALAAAVYLFVLVRPLDMPAREVQTFNADGLSLMFSPSRNLNNWYFSVYAVMPPLFAVTALGAIIAYIISRRKGWRVLNWHQVALLLIFSGGGVLMASSFTNVWLDAGKIRHILPVSVAMIALWGAGVEQIIWTATRFLQERRPNLKPSWLTAGVFAALALVMLPGYTTGNIAVIQEYRRTAIEPILWKWADVNIPNDGMILAHRESRIGRTWNRPWSGYDGTKPFAWWHELEADIAASTPEIYVERGIRYFVMDSGDRRSWFNSPEAKAFLDQLTLVKTIPTSDDIFGNTVFFYRMLPPQHSADALYGDQIALVGYDLEAESFQPGATITFRPYWRAAALPSANYSLFIHLYPADEDQLIAQYDGAPTVLERPTLTWDDPEELMIGSITSLTIPADTPSGEYRLALGLYDFNTGARLTVDDAQYFAIPITVIRQ